MKKHKKYECGGNIVVRLFKTRAIIFKLFESGLIDAVSAREEDDKEEKFIPFCEKCGKPASVVFASIDGEKPKMFCV